SEGEWPLCAERIRRSPIQFRNRIRTGSTRNSSCRSVFRNGPATAGCGIPGIRGCATTNDRGTWCGSGDPAGQWEVLIIADRLLAGDGVCAGFHAASSTVAMTIANVATTDTTVRL